jgi:hypothetical protein
MGSVWSFFCHDEGEILTGGIPAEAPIDYALEATPYIVHVLSRSERRQARRDLKRQEEQEARAIEN